ncbi:hypothetical protein GW17_00057325 [Ensete ventricosum]|nr:hypothetical protein GW17_00057325 [Ensete ventricosum]
MSNPMKTPHKFRDQSKYDRFHQDYGHDTKECRELKIRSRSSYIGDTSDATSKGLENPLCAPTDRWRSRLMLLSVTGGDSTLGRRAYTHAVREENKRGVAKWDLAGSSLGDSLKGSGSSLGTRREIAGKKTRGLTARMSEATGLYGKNPAGKSLVSGGWTAHTTESGWRLVAFDG